MFDDANARCPYFISANGIKNAESRIRCEGYIDDSNVELTFRRNEQMDKYRLFYCDSYQYGQCKMHQLLTQIKEGKQNDKK